MIGEENNKEDIGAEQPETHWRIDLDWFELNSRSFFTLALGCLCPNCRKQLKEGEISEESLLETISSCCCNVPDFITLDLPILESIFRVFLANGNQSFNLEELGQQLNERRGVDAYRTSAEVLSRLLKADEYYGIREIET